MRKRLVIPLSIILIITAILLLISIFKLYTEAEKVQKSIFTRDVISATDHVINQIDAVLKGEPISSESLFSILSIEKNDSVPALLTKYTRKFLLDSLLTKPVGIVRTTISYMGKNMIHSIEDTTYFDTTYRQIFLYSSPNWQENFDANQFENKLDKGKTNRYKKDINLIEMDSTTLDLLNRDFLNRIIKESLGDIARQYKFDFAIYNEFTTNFAIQPDFVDPKKMLTSEFVFKLKNNDHFLAPHHLILYFPEERGIYFQMMGAIALLIIAFLGIILIISGYTLYHLYRQKKITDIRDDFVNNMTHEFKTPIATIALACEAIADESTQKDPALQASYVSIIQDENDRLKNMVGDILQLAQMKKGQLKLHYDRVDMHDLLQSIVSSLSLQVISSKGVLALQLDAEECMLVVDKNHIENVIINLIENAIKYAQKSPHIKIGTHIEKKNFVISIKDNGIGIHKKNIKKIFNEFYRVSKGNVHNTKGFGLGLDYVKKIISLHGGSITVESEISKGTIFTLYLPIKKE